MNMKDSEVQGRPENKDIYDDANFGDDDDDDDDEKGEYV
jgi:hypothetical protein